MGRASSWLEVNKNIDIIKSMSGFYVMETSVFKSFYANGPSLLPRFLMFSGGIERDQWHELG